MADLGRSVSPLLDGERLWVCARCGSDQVEVAVYWAGSVEPVDQRSEKIEPASCYAEAGELGSAFCNACHAEDDPSDLLVRVVPPAPPLAQADDTPSRGQRETS
jgi:hypothetical protein